MMCANKTASARNAHAARTTEEKAGTHLLREVARSDPTPCPSTLVGGLSPPMSGFGPPNRAQSFGKSAGFSAGNENLLDRLSYCDRVIGKPPHSLRK